jgi:cell wall assembly regulator SMI1
MPVDPDTRRRLEELLAKVVGPPAVPPPMSELLPRLDALLRERRPGYYAALRPGLTDLEWDAFRSRLGLDVPAALRALYQWKDGQRGDCYENIHGNYMFVPAESVLETKRICDGMIGSDFDRPGWWEPTWVPFLDNGGGDNLCLDVAGAYGGRPGQLVEFWHDREKRGIRYPSLEHWVFQVVESLDPSPDNRHPETDTGPPVGNEVW